MARVMIDDLWLRDADDGTPPSSAAKRALSRATDPLKANVPDKWRSSKYGRGKRWRCRWYMPVDGVRMQRSKAFTKLADAEEFRAAMEDDARRGRYHDPSQEQRLFSDVAREWLEGKLDLKASTRSRYERELRVYLLPKWGGMTLREIQRRDVQQWVASLSTGDYPALLPHGRRPRALKPRSIRNIVKVVMAGVTGYACERHWLAEDPLTGVTTPKIVNSDDDMVFLTIPEVELLADEAETVGGPVDSTLVRFLAYTGLRVNEALALKVGDVDVAGMRVRVSRTWTDDGEGGQTLGPPKNGKARWTAMPGFTLELLRPLMDGQPDDAWLFRASRGGNIWLHNWRTRVWYRAVRNAGMEDEGVTIHSLRHSYASIAIASGADVKTLQLQLGHASATITLDTYAALWPERLGEVASAVGRVWEARGRWIARRERGHSGTFRDIPGHDRDMTGVRMFSWTVRMPVQGVCGIARGSSSPATS